MSNVTTFPHRISFDHFFQRLRHLRDVRGYTQAELDERAGFTSNAVAQFESGKRLPSFENLSKIALALSCTADFLLGHSDSPTQHWENPILRKVMSLPAQDMEYVAVFVEALTRRNGDRKVSPPARDAVEP